MMIGIAARSSGAAYAAHFATPAKRARASGQRFATAGRSTTNGAARKKRTNAASQASTRGHARAVYELLSQIIQTAIAESPPSA